MIYNHSAVDGDGWVTETSIELSRIVVMKSARTGEAYHEVYCTGLAEPVRLLALPCEAVATEPAFDRSARENLEALITAWREDHNFDSGWSGREQLHMIYKYSTVDGFGQVIDTLIDLSCVVAIKCARPYKPDHEVYCAGLAKPVLLPRMPGGAVTSESEFNRSAGENIDALVAAWRGHQFRSQSTTNPEHTQAQTEYEDHYQVHAAFICPAHTRAAITRSPKTLPLAAKL